MKEFRLRHKHSDIRVFCDLDLRSEAESFLADLYDDFEVFCQKNPFFLISYEPVDPILGAPPMVENMVAAAKAAGVGPMAAVAGSVAEEMASFLLAKDASEVLVENGGDIFLKLASERVVGIHAGASDFSGKLGFKVLPKRTPLSICTSSSSVGHSISLGDSDAVSAVAGSGALADASATAIGNEVKGSSGLEKGIEYAKKIKGLSGALIIRGNRLASWGVLPELVHTKKSKDY